MANTVLIWPWTRKNGLTGLSCLCDSVAFPNSLMQSSFCILSRGSSSLGLSFPPWFVGTFSPLLANRWGNSPEYCGSNRKQVSWANCEKDMAWRKKPTLLMVQWPGGGCEFSCQFFLSSSCLSFFFSHGRKWKSELQAWTLFTTIVDITMAIRRRQVFGRGWRAKGMDVGVGMVAPKAGRKVDKRSRDLALFLFCFCLERSY